MNAMFPSTPTLGTIIAYIESANNAHAMRFEPTVHERIHVDMLSDKIIANIRKLHKCTYETACIIYSSSFGLFQIMGNVLYDPSFIDCKVDIFTYCSNTFMQNQAFQIFVTRRNICFTIEQLTIPANRMNFALHYNGGADYADNILNALRHFGVISNVASH